MTFSFRPAQDTDAAAVTAIFNHYVQHSFAAYPDTTFDESFYSRLRGAGGSLPFYVIVGPQQEVVGFGQLRPIHLANTLRRAAEATIFILPQYVRHGLGQKLLGRLEADARALGVDTLIGGASSLNQPSLDFQKRCGFTECGRFRRVGRKFDQDFDIVWMQKFI